MRLLAPSRTLSASQAPPGRVRPHAAASTPNLSLHPRRAGEWEPGSIEPAASRFVHDFSRVPARAPAPQPVPARIAVGPAGDEYERQADQAAAERMAAGRPAAGGIPPRIQRFSARPAGRMDAAPASVGHALAQAGRPLEPALRRDMEQRFDHDFSGVRVHADGAAARSARDVGASAYTVGRHIVFGAGEFAPATHQGRLLLAHELTHTVQQSAVAGVPPLQRKCNADLGTPSPDCKPAAKGAVGWQFQFKVGCDDLLPGEEDKIDKLKLGHELFIHGFASKDGGAAFNDALSCHRARRIAELAAKRRPDCPVIEVFKHGESPVPAPGAAPDTNPPDFWRSVVVEEVKPALQSGEAWLDPSSTINRSRALLLRAQANPTPANLAEVAALRPDLKKWLTSIAKTLAPAGSQLTRQKMDDYRRFFNSAEDVWQKSDALLALHKHADAGKDTYTAWAVGPGADQGPGIHATGVPTNAKYHVDIFGEGYFKGAINIGMSERTSTTGINDSRVPHLIYRRFSAKDARLPIADHAADLVTAENGPLRIPGLAEEIARIIAPGGTIILHNPDSEEASHDQVITAVGGTSSKKRSKTPGGTEMITTTIIAPGP
ncbi:MAG TPA: DUF4157 domain-containing protein [Longimicrobium sp.]